MFAKPALLLKSDAALRPSQVCPTFVPVNCYTLPTMFAALPSTWINTKWDACCWTKDRCYRPARVWSVPAVSSIRRWVRNCWGA